MSRQTGAEVLLQLCEAALRCALPDMERVPGAAAIIVEGQLWTTDASCVGPQPISAHRDHFRIYSMSKVVTATTLAVVAAKAGVHPDAGVLEFIGDVVPQPKRDLWTNVTLRHLLWQCAGLGGGGVHPDPHDRVERFEHNACADTRTSLEVAEELLRLGPIEPPGVRFRYGRSYDVLGAIIERMAGVPLDIAVEAALHGVGLQHGIAFAAPASDVVNPCALPSSPPYALRSPCTPPNYLSGGSGLLATPVAFARFLDRLCWSPPTWPDGGGLWSSIPSAILRDVDYVPGPGYAWACGFAKSDEKSPVIGYWLGRASTVFIVVPERRTTIVLMQQRYGVARETARFLLEGVRTHLRQPSQ